MTNKKHFGLAKPASTKGLIHYKKVRLKKKSDSAGNQTCNHGLLDCQHNHCSALNIPTRLEEMLYI